MTGVDIAAHASEAGGASPLPTGSVQTGDHSSLAAAGSFSEALAAQTDEERPVPVTGVTPGHLPFAVGDPGGEPSESESELNETTAVIPEVDVSLPLEDRVAHARLAMLAPVDAALVAWDSARALIWKAVIILLIVSIGDYGLQRWRHNTSLKMTKREVKDDTRLTEGSPETKARVRRIQRDMARRRMLADVPKATVVITNPTEYAIALDYQRELLPAPRVVAKGRNAMARRIREIAREHGVPIVENKPLARALHAATEIGDLIPADLFDAVAEVLVYLVRLKQLRL